MGHTIHDYLTKVITFNIDLPLKLPIFDFFKVQIAMQLYFAIIFKIHFTFKD